MNRIARYNPFIMMLLLIIVVSTSGCSAIRNPLGPKTNAIGPGINNSVELLDYKIGDRFFDNISSGAQAPSVSIPVGYKTHVVWYKQSGEVYRQYDIEPDGVFGEHTDIYGNPCDFIAFARGSGTTARSAKPASVNLTSEEAFNEGLFQK